MKYRIVNDSRLTEETAEALVRFAFAYTPTIDRLTAVKLRDGSYPSGRAYWGTKPKWAGRARWAVVTAVPGDRLLVERPRICWHSSAARAWMRDRYEQEPSWERCTEDFYSMLAERYASGETHFGRWPIFFTRTVEEAVLHTVAHELMHVLAADRGRKTQSELLCEEHAKRVLDTYQEARCFSPTT